VKCKWMRIPNFDQILRRLCDGGAAPTAAETQASAERPYAASARDESCAYGSAAPVSGAVGVSDATSAL
jgi:hypothetical protein